MYIILELNMKCKNYFIKNAIRSFTDMTADDPMAFLD